MQVADKTIITALILITVFLITTPGHSHVGNHMPDPVAEMEYRILLELKPRDFTTRVKLAIVLMNLDKLSEAESEFTRSLAASPRDLAAHIGLSQLRLKQNRVKDALLVIKKALAIDPENAAVYLNFGLILEADNQPREALGRYLTGVDKLATKPKNPENLHDRQQLDNAIKNLQDKLNNIPPVKRETSND